MRRTPRELIDRYRTRERASAGAAAEAERAEQSEQSEQSKHESLELRERIAQQWAEVRAARRAMEVEPEIAAGPSNLRRGQVPYGMDLAAAWAWRFVVISVAGAIILWLLAHFVVVVLPLAIALLIAALAAPVVT